MVAEPKYREIADDLRRKIEAAELIPGSRLPTEIELMEQYGASRNTVRDAIKLLTTRSLVETRPGQGTYVVQQIEPFVAHLTGPADSSDTGVYEVTVKALGRRPENGPIRVEVQQANTLIARALGIEQGSQVVSRHQQRFIDGTPWSLQTTFYPMTLVQEKQAMRLIQAVDIAEGTVAYLARECGVKQNGYRDLIAVRTPDENETAFFRLPADGRIPVFVLNRVGFYQDGVPFRLTVTVCPADRNRFVIEVGQVPATNSLAGGE
jgi:GntR family transcriptional regulator